MNDEQKLIEMLKECVILLREGTQEHAEQCAEKAEHLIKSFDGTTYEIRVPFSGYVRGDYVYTVRANSEKEANGVDLSFVTPREEIERDDRDEDWSNSITERVG